MCVQVQRFARFESMVERIPITDVRPLVEHGRYPVKATTGETLTVTANVFREGHDLLGAARRPDRPSRQGPSPGPDGQDRRAGLLHRRRHP